MSNVEHKASLSIDFLIVGGGLAGLGCAVGLARAGHKVTVLEEDDGTKKPSGGLRSPPNMSKILMKWDLLPQLKKIALLTENVDVLTYDTGRTYGVHRWDAQLMAQTGGSYYTVQHNELHRMLLETAVSLGVQVRHKAKALFTGTNGSDRPSVTLASGEVLLADVIIGADGPDSVVRECIFGKCSYGTPMGLLLWNTTVPKNKMREDPELTYFLDQDPTLFCYYGDSRSVVAYNQAGEEHFAMHIFTPDDGTLRDPGRGSWTERFPPSMMQKAMGSCEPRLAKLAKLALPPTCVRIFHTPQLEEWIHESAPIALLGEAAHPLPAGAILSTGMALGDAGCLSELFSHLSAYDQIPSFLSAYQDIRIPRRGEVAVQEVENLQFMTLPPSPMQQARDATMKAAYDKGRSVFDGEDVYEGTLRTFGYDAMDEANNWWVQWGLLNERIKGRVTGDLEISVDRAAIVREA